MAAVVVAVVVAVAEAVAVRPCACRSSSARWRSCGARWRSFSSGGVDAGQIAEPSSGGGGVVGEAEKEKEAQEKEEEEDDEEETLEGHFEEVLSRESLARRSQSAALATRAARAQGQRGGGAHFSQHGQLETLENITLATVNRGVLSAETARSTLRSVLASVGLHK